MTESQVATQEKSGGVRVTLCEQDSLCFSQAYKKNKETKVVERHNAKAVKYIYTSNNRLNVKIRLGKEAKYRNTEQEIRLPIEQRTEE